MAVYSGLLEPGDTVLSLRLDHGGHLTHGLKVNFSGRLYTIVHYGVSRETALVDEDEVLALAREHRPRLIICGGSAYPRTVDTAMFRRVADEVGALLWCDMAHFAGLVAAGLHPNPVEHCDVVTSTTHKTLAGPRSGFVLCREEHAQAIDRAVFPGLQGGPLEHVIAAKATCFKIAASEEFRAYQQQVRTNADALRRDPARRRPRPADGRHRHAPPAARPALDRLDGQGRRGAAARGRADDEPQHRAVRRAAADGRLGRPRRHAGRDDARVRRGRLPRGRPDRGRGARPTTRRSLRCARVQKACARDGRSTPASVATRRTSPKAERRGRRQHDQHPRDGKRHGGAAPARAAQARPPARRHDDDADVPSARQRADAAPHLRGDEGPRGRAGRDRDAARANDGDAHLGQEGRDLPDPARGRRDARRRALAHPGRPRRVHRPLPQRGDARAGRVLREAAERHRRPRRDPPRPDARDGQLDRRRGRDGQARPARRPSG